MSCACVHVMIVTPDEITRKYCIPTINHIVYIGTRSFNNPWFLCASLITQRILNSTSQTNVKTVPTSTSDTFSLCRFASLAYRDQLVQRPIPNQKRNVPHI